MFIFLNLLNSEKVNKNDVSHMAFSLGEELTDALDLKNKSGIYITGPTTVNLPNGGTYGQINISKNIDNSWVFVQFLPTGLQSIYYNFYNGYGEANWSGWVKILTQKM